MVVAKDPFTLASQFTANIVFLVSAWFVVCLESCARFENIRSSSVSRT